MVTDPKARQADAKRSRDLTKEHGGKLANRRGRQIEVDDRLDSEAWKADTVNMK